MSDAVGGPAERARRVQQRVDEFLNVPRFVSAAAVVYSVLAMFFWADTDVPYLVRLFGALTAFATIPPAWVSAAHGKRSASTRFAAAFFLIQVLFFGYEYSWRPSPFGPGVLRDALTVIAACTVLVVAATATGWVGSAKAVITATLLAAGLIVVSGVDHWRRPGEPRDKGGPFGDGVTRQIPRDAREPRSQALGPPARPRPESGQVDWSYSASTADDVLEFRNVPHGAIKTFYPSNPRGTFDVEPDAESFDMRCVRLLLGSDAAAATLQPPPFRHSPARVRIDRVLPNAPWSTILLHRAAVEAGGRYVALAKVRADRPRVVGVNAIEHAKEPPAPPPLASSYYAVDERWSILPLAVRVPASVDRLLVQLLLGQSTGQVEVAWMALGRARDGGLGRQDLRAFGPSSDSDPARIVESWADRVVVEAPAGAAGRKMDAASILAAVGPVAPGQAFVAAFRARGEAEGAIGARWNSGDAQSRAISNAAEAPLAPVWRDVQLELSATAAANEARLEILLGGAKGRVEIADLVVTRKGESASLAPISYQASPWAYSVLHRMNGEGYRDSEWTLVPPENTFRIACLGDSYTFGQGVRAADAFTTLVEERLNELSGPGGRSFEVLNFGVCGYSTRQERLLYEHVASRFRPNLVLVVMHHNDNMSNKEEVEYHRRRKQAEAGGLLSIPGRLFSETVGKPDHKVCAEELLLLRDRCRRDGVPLAVCAFRNGEGKDWDSLFAAVEPAMRQAGVPFKDLGVDLMQGRGWKELAVHEIDGHPNELAHRIAAESLVDWLKANSLVRVPVSGERRGSGAAVESP